MGERKVVFVTGSGKGIGKGIALAFAKAGYDVAVHHRDSEKEAQAVAESVRALGAQTVVIQGDISVLSDIDRMFVEFSQAFDRLDVMVNNAGITKFKPFLEADPETFEAVINTDFRGSFFCAQKAARIMVDKQIPGVIINITSNHQIGCWPTANIYAPAKAALNKFSENIAMELAPYGIRAVSVAPGYTNSWGIPKEKPVDMPQARWDSLQEILRRIPMGRMATIDEVGGACVFLAGEHAGYITGTCLHMDGGALLPVLPENTYV